MASPKRPESAKTSSATLPSPREAHETSAPASISGAPVSHEASTRVHTRSGEIPVVSPRESVPAEWLDTLLVATIELPVSEGEEAVVRAMLGALATIFPTCGVGACIVVPTPPNEPRKSAPSLDAAARSGEQSVWKITPRGEDHRAVGMDPTRLFPGYAYEQAIEAEPNGTTLHIAGDDPEIEQEESALRQALARAAQGMGRGLLFAREHKKAMNDASNLRALNSHLVQTEKLASLGQIAAGVVHELNNPLTSIVAYTDYLIRKMTQESRDDSDIERLRRIGESATRMLRFTRDLVTYSRPSQQKPAPVRIESVIDRALAFCEHVLAEVGAKVERSGAVTRHVNGMPEQLAQVFVNLITNAVHAMPPEGGKLSVSTRIDGSQVIVVVEDNGHGIPEDHLGHIFVPFFTTKTEGRGTGLGLSIVKNIVEEHHGEIWAERVDSGGARFVISLRALDE